MSRNDSSKSVDNLDDYIVLIDVEAGTQYGTGFFIAPGMILTCAHVVVLDQGCGSLGKDISLNWRGRIAPAQVVHLTNFPFPDLAILTVAWSDNPYLRLGEDIRQSNASPNQYVFKGFPDGGPSSGGMLSFDDTKNYFFDENGHPLDTPIAPTGSRNAHLLKFKDSIIRVGQSGSPVLAIPTDSVCGVLRTNRSQNLPLGGLAIPVSYVKKTLHEIKSINNKPFSWSEIEQNLFTPDKPRDSIPPPNEGAKIKAQIGEYVRRAYVEKALLTAINFAEAKRPDMLIDWQTIAGNHESLKKQEMLGIISSSEARTERNKITYAILNLAAKFTEA